MPTTTLAERVTARGIGTSDDALPQDWFDRVMVTTGFSPRGHVVWSYDQPNTIFGQAVAVDAIGDLMLARLLVEDIVPNKSGKVVLQNHLGSALFELMGVGE